MPGVAECAQNGRPHGMEDDRDDLQVYSIVSNQLRTEMISRYIEQSAEDMEAR